MGSMIKKIVLQLGDKEVELTVEQARMLHELLDEMYGQKTQFISYPIVYRESVSYWDYSTPMWYSGGTTTAPTMSYAASSGSVYINLSGTGTANGPG